MHGQKTGLQLVLDLDGVMYHGARVKAGAVDLYNWIQAEEIPCHFHTNSGQQTRQEIQAKLGGMGIRCRTADITTASESVAACIKADYPDVCRVYTIGGGRGLQQELDLLGITPVALGESDCGVSPSAPLPLVIGLTEDFNYQMMTRLLEIEHTISDIYSTDNDGRFIADGHLLPGTGWQNAAIEHVLHKKVKSAGKPARWALEYVLSQKLKTRRENVIIIGDNIYSDIAGGNAMNCRTILVMGGTTRPDQLENLACADHKPTYVAQNMEHCHNILRELYQ